jgi:tight adherence protein C
VTPDRLTLIWTITAAIVVLVGISANMLAREARRRDLESRVVQASWGSAAAGSGSYTGPAGLLQRLGDRVRHGTRLYAERDIKHLEAMIHAAGLDPRRVLPLLLGAKLLVMILLPVTAAIAAGFLARTIPMRLMIIGAGVFGGILGPEAILGMLRRPYIAALQRGTPDALDLLVVCSEAGMGLESALERVSREMLRSNRPTALALASLLDDLRVLPDRREAFTSFGKRSGVEGLQRLATMLAQSLQYGTPLSSALRSVVTELRRERANQLEERATKLPAKLIFPLILFIMPSLYIVLLGTSFMHLYDALGSFTATLPIHH